MGSTSPEARELFNLFAQHQAEQRSQKLAQVTASFQTLPASEEVLEELCALSPQNAFRALRTHPGYHMQRNLESIESMLGVSGKTWSELPPAVCNLTISSRSSSKPSASSEAQPPSATPAAMKSPMYPRLCATGTASSERVSRFCRA